MKAGEPYFIPKSFSVGIFTPGKSVWLGQQFPGVATSAQHGFVTCRFKYDQWVSSDIFERLTKYRPSTQRDSAAQLRKYAAGVVSEFDNAPTAGFRLVSWGGNPCGYSMTRYDFSGDVVLLDPRGFLVALQLDRFFETLSMCGGSVSEYVLPGEFVYGWSHQDKSLALVPTAYQRYEEWKAASDACMGRSSGRRVGVPKRDMSPGKVYRGEGVLKGDWMYVGVYDTYSAACHMDAYDNGGVYNVGAAMDKESGMLREKWRHVVWPTTKGKMVFYSMRPDKQQYAVRSDVSGVFQREIPPREDGTYADDSGEVYMMYSDPSRPATLANVLDDVASSPAFNKIRFTAKPVLAPMPFEAFSRALSNQPSRFPTDVHGNRSFIFTSAGRYVKVQWSNWYANSLPVIKVFDIGSASSAPSWTGRLRVYSVSYGSVAAAYGRLSPEYPEYTFENGRPVRPEHAVAFAPQDVRKKADRAY